MLCNLFRGLSASVSAIAWLSWLAGSVVHAEDPGAGIKYLQSEYIVDTWQTEQGLPDDQVNDIEQTPDGYLWIATFNGLARFNGVNFTIFDSANTPELPGSRITNLNLDRNGRLWIRTELGNLTLFVKGRFQTFCQPDGSPLKGISGIKEDRAGEVWFGLSASRTNYLHFVNGALEPESGTRTFTERFGTSPDSQGYGWVMRSNVLISLNPENPVKVQIPGYQPGQGHRLHASRDGGLWVIVQGFKKFYSLEDRWEDYGPLPRNTDLFNGYIEDHQGNLWLGTGIGELWRVDTNRITRRFKLLNSAPRDFKVVFQDAEENLWLGTWGSGLARIKPRAFKTYDSKDGISSDIVRSVTQDRDGNIWLAGVSQVDWFPPNHSGRAERRGLNVSLPWKVFGSRNGPLWIGTFTRGLFRFEGESGTWFPFAEAVRPPIDVIFEDAQGEIYAGTPRGLFVVRSDSLERCPPPRAAITMDVNSMAEDSKGRLYLGLGGDGLLRESGAGWECFATKDGLPDNNISAICVDKQDNLWIATHGRGLARFKDGRFFNFSAAQVALPRFVSRLIEDDTGHLWFTSNQGLFRANLAELNAVAEGRNAAAETTHYDRTDGMGSSQCFGSAWKARDGKLWIATMNGLTVVDPHSLPMNARPPPVVIEQALVDDQPVQIAPREGTRPTIKVPPGAHRLEIHYAGLSFTAPSKLRFQYRLQGLDENWVHASGRRVAYYTKIPPGPYRFHVIAANNDNVWNNTGASLAVVVQPYLWQTAWFQIVGALFLIGGAAGLVRYISLIRLRRRLADLERRHALERERVRISRDLHDNLGADLSQLALWSELAARDTNRPEETAARVRSVSALAREVIQNVEEIVWTVNPRNDSLNSFAAYVCEFSERVISSAGVRFRWEAPDNIPAVPLPSNIRHHLFLVTKEALNNLVKHAAATEARVQLGIEGDAFVVAISDNGRGFDEAAASTNGGNGLANMRARIVDCGGQLTIQSRNGSGTTIRLRVPLAVLR